MGSASISASPTAGLASIGLGLGLGLGLGSGLGLGLGLGSGSGSGSGLGLGSGLGIGIGYALDGRLVHDHATLDVHLEVRVGLRPFARAALTHPRTIDLARHDITWSATVKRL